MRIFIIRHADPYYPTDSLTEKGQREAELLSKRLIGENIDAFYLSPHGRAQLTAKPTMDKMGKKGVVCEWLREFPGQLSQKIPTRAVGREPAGTRCLWNLPPEEWVFAPGIYDSEGWRNQPIYEGCGVEERFDKNAKSFDQLVAEHGFVREGGLYRILPGFENSEETIALFCHLGLGNALLAHIANFSLPAVWHTIFLPTSSVTTVFMEKHRDTPIAHARLVGIGDTSHLFAGGEPISCAGLFTDRLR